MQLLPPCFVVCLSQVHYTMKRKILRPPFSFLFVPVPHRHGYRMKSFWDTLKYISSLSTKFTTGIYAVIGFAGLFVSYNDFFSDDTSAVKRLAVGTSVLVTLWVVPLLITLLILKCKKNFKILNNNGHALYVQYGDLFGQKELKNTYKRWNIVVPVNRCFDTRVDNHVVSEESVHGSAFQKLYQSGVYTEESLSTKLDRLLARTEYEELTRREKPDGRRKRYPVGTVVDLPGIGEEHYLLCALSTFDEKIKARTEMQNFTVAVQSLIEAINTYSEGYPVLMPLIGAGLSRLDKEQQEILRYLISAIIFNKDKINCDIHVVIRKNLKNEISIFNLK